MTGKDRIDFNDSVAKLLLETELIYSDQIALKYKNLSYTYQSLFEKAKAIAAILKRSPDERCLIITERTPAAYIGLLATLLSGKAYIFLNKKDIFANLKKTISLAKSNLCLTDESNLAFFHKIIADLPETFNTVCLNVRGNPVKNTIDFLDKSSLCSNPDYTPPDFVYKYAYLMFTSGSTGMPKGVPITNINLTTFLYNIMNRANPNQSDKFSQINELTFDFSVYEILTCWFAGACLCVLPDNYIIGIDKYIKKHGITFWSCVPSFVNIMKKLNKIDRNGFESIRYSIFCGEPLTHQLAALWQRTAPNSTIDNLYGPTEATVAITGYIWQGNEKNGVLPIGWPFDNQQIFLLDSYNQEVKQGETGEICLAGAQVCEKYWNNETSSTACFINYDGLHLYRTGDLAYKDENEMLYYKGRIDDQLKINGYRIEKLDIENHIKNILNTQSVAILVHRNEQTNTVESLTCFVADTIADEKIIIQLCRKFLPEALMPSNFIKLNQLPLNKNGKVDYSTLCIIASSNKQRVKKWTPSNFIKNNQL